MRLNLGKDIRHPADTNYQPGNLIDLRDLKDSPENQGPPWSSPADPLDEIVTFFVTDGTYVTSAQIHIKAADQGFDVVVTDLVSRPDLLIGNIWENVYSRNNIYNSTGEGQERSQVVDVNISAKYSLRVENDGTRTERFIITGDAGGWGWTVKYYDALIGGNDITAQVIGSGWITPLLCPARLLSSPFN